MDAPDSPRSAGSADEEARDAVDDNESKLKEGGDSGGDGGDGGGGVGESAPVPASFLDPEELARTLPFVTVRQEMLTKINFDRKQFGYACVGGRHGDCSAGGRVHGLRSLPTGCTHASAPSISLVIVAFYLCFSFVLWRSPRSHPHPCACWTWGCFSAHNCWSRSSPLPVWQAVAPRAGYGAVSLR